MLNCIHLQNLKCFEALSLPLEPLTLLTGFNAAGKSTTLQSLLLLSQASQQANICERIALNGHLVRLGSPSEVLYENANNKNIVLAIESVDCRIEWHLTADSRHLGPTLGIERVVVVQDDEEHLYSNNILNPSNCQDLSLAIKEKVNSLRNLIFISAARMGVEDLYPVPDEVEPIFANVGPSGQFAPWWFERLSDEPIDELRCHKDEQANTLRRQLNAWFGEIFPSAEANARLIENTSLVQLTLRNTKTGEWRSPSNIGYGLTYAFPILIAGLLAKQGQILIVDSPEAHLHPQGQSKMGMFLSMVAAAGVQVVVETHSDHVLNGARLAVYHNTIEANHIATHFFNPASKEEVAQVISPIMNSNGNLSEWPEGFFDQAEKDLSTLTGWG